MNSKSHKLTSFAITLLAILAVLLPACSPKKSFFIGVSQCSEDSWRTKMNSEIRRESYLYDNVRVEFASAKDDNRVQIAQIERQTSTRPLSGPTMWPLGEPLGALLANILAERGA